MKKIFVAILILFFITNVNVLATSDNNVSKNNFQRNVASQNYSVNKLDSVKLNKYLSNLTLSELEDFIRECEKRADLNQNNLKLNRDLSTEKLDIIPNFVPPDQLAVAAWFAASKAAKIAGFTCSGTILEKSIEGNNYYETNLYSSGRNGICGSKIKNSQSYKRINKHISSTDAFRKDDNFDLFLGIHKYSYKPVYTYGPAIQISDVFDFQYNGDFGNWLVNLVNNFGYLNQNIGILKNIRVTIIVK